MQTIAAAIPELHLLIGVVSVFVRLKGDTNARSSHAGWIRQSLVPAQRQPALIENQLSIPQQMASMTTGLAALEQCLSDSATSVTPLILAVGGLEPAITELVRDCPLPVRLDLTIHGRLPRHVEAHVYQLMDECLSYLVEHTGSPRADAYLTSTAGLVQFGIDAACSACFASNVAALTALCTRAADMGATLVATRRARGGLRLRVTIPAAGAASSGPLPRAS